jgi:hypothetical protein
LQTQKGYDTYNFPLDFKFNIDSSTSVLKTFFIDKRQKNFEVTLKYMPLDIEPDPSNWILADIKKKK